MGFPFGRWPRQGTNWLPEGAERPPPKGPEKGLLAGRVTGDYFWEPTRPLWVDLASGSLGPLFPGNTTKMAK